MINCRIDGGHAFLISIGNNCTITNSALIAHDASMKKVIGYSKVGRIDIGDNVFIGHGTIVLCNVRIGSNTIIGAGSVVTHDIPSNSVAVGNPARVIGSYSEYIEKHEKNLETFPVYNVYYPKKSEKDRQVMLDELKNQYGYDL